MQCGFIVGCVGVADLVFDIVHLQVLGVWDLGPVSATWGAPYYQELLMQPDPIAHLLPLLHQRSPT